MAGSNDFQILIIFLIDILILVIYSVLSFLTILYIIPNLSKISILWAGKLVLILSGLYYITGTVLYAKGVFRIIHSGKLMFYIFVTMKLSDTLIIILLFRKRAPKYNLVLKSHKVIMFCYFLIFIVLLTVTFDFFEKSNEILFPGKRWIFFLNPLLMVLFCKLLYDFIKAKTIFPIKIEFLLKMKIADCLINIAVIIFFSFDYVYMKQLQIVLNALILLYSYKETQFLMKYDFYQFIEDEFKENIFKNMNFICRIFMLEDMVAKFNEELEEALLENERKPINVDLMNLAFDKTKEFYFLNFCILNEVFKKKANSVHQLDGSFDSFELAKEQSPNKLATDIYKLNLLETLDNYFLKEEILSINKFTKYFNEINPDEAISIESYHYDKFQEIITYLNLNYQAFVQSTDPSKNSKMCQRIEINVIENPTLNNFQTSDCFLSYEIYDIKKLNQINAFLGEYFRFITNTEISFLPIIVGIFKISFLNQEYIVISYRNSNAFSVMYDVRDSFLLSFNDTTKEVNYSSKKEIGIMADFTEVNLIDEFAIEDEDHIHIKEVLKSDMNFLKASLGTSFKIQVFIINDNTCILPEKQKKSLVKSNLKFNPLMASRFSFSDNINNYALTPSSMTSLEELFVLSNLGGNSRYILKITFSNIFGDSVTTDKNSYLKNVEKNLLDYFKQKSMVSNYKNVTTRENQSFIKRSIIIPTFQ